jgi:hypothetical protein
MGLPRLEALPLILVGAVVGGWAAWQVQQLSQQKCGFTTVAGVVAGSIDRADRRPDLANSNTVVSSEYKFPIPGGISKVMIDIGLYSDILPPEEGELVIAVDASAREIERNKLYTLCANLQRCLLINAAVGKSDDMFVTLHQSNRKGGSSHITSFDDKVWPMELKPAIVPIMSLKTLIDSVPSHLPIPLCKLDTNGNDGNIIKSAGSSLERCQRLTMEIVGDLDHTGPQGQYETALSVMSAHGFQLAPGKPSAKRAQFSYNIYFVRPEFASVYGDHIAGSKGQ